MFRTADRLSFYCVSIPGSAAWVSEALGETAGAPLPSLKRGAGEGEEAPKKLKGEQGESLPRSGAGAN